jgi:26S proteasome non-ATPase regulatory subunit 10
LSLLCKGARAIDFHRLPLYYFLQVNAKDKANQHPLHRAATTNATGFISLLLNPPGVTTKTRLNTADRVGNTPLHLAMESGHAEAAVLLIEAGAARDRVSGKIKSV